MKSIPAWMYKNFIAHRGYFNTSNPENSLAAFKRAVEHGYAIELDVQILKDDTLIVFHDTHLKRMTGLDKSLLECTYEDIKGLRLLDTDEKIPTFSECLDLVNGQVPLMIEFKNESQSTHLEETAYEVLKSYTGQYIIQSFNPLSVLWFKQHAAHIVRGQLSCKHKKLGFIKRFVMRNVMTNIITRPDFVIYDIQDLDAWIIRRLQINKMPLFGYTAKSIEDYKMAKAKGINACFEGFDPKDL